jgi:hypothetical protein
MAIAIADEWGRHRRVNIALGWRLVIGTKRTADSQFQVEKRCTSQEPSYKSFRRNRRKCIHGIKIEVFVVGLGFVGFWRGWQYCASYLLVRHSIT